eukprot:TRINITY_DN73841_c0_g1_i1.p1 TRINITY_DN73841_c0_g1~~TRINITY_DN73841_c0_g1_i1.p1  ORF type:complete len:1493 (-),score=277.85 TRINITY_DN73841_c0_g1_i1:389-4867(-)
MAEEPERGQSALLLDRGEQEGSASTGHAGGAKTGDADDEDEDPAFRLEAPAFAAAEPEPSEDDLEEYAAALLQHAEVGGGSFGGSAPPKQHSDPVSQDGSGAYQAEAAEALKLAAIEAAPAAEAAKLLAEDVIAQEEVGAPQRAAASASSAAPAMAVHPSEPASMPVGQHPSREHAIVEEGAQRAIPNEQQSKEEGILVPLLPVSEKGKDSRSKPAKPTFGERINKICWKGLVAYSAQVERRPWCIMIIVTLVVGLLIGVLFKTPEIEFDFSTFIRADGDSALRRDALLLALAKRKGPNSRRLSAIHDEVYDEILRLDNGVSQVLSSEQQGSSFDGAGRQLVAGTVLILTRQLEIIYTAEYDWGQNEREINSVFHSKMQRKIRDFELGLRGLAGWKSLCAKVASDLGWACDPGESMMSYAWAAQSPADEQDPAGSRFNIRFNAAGGEQVPVPAYLALMQQGQLSSQSDYHEVLDMRRYFPPSFQFPLQNGTGGLVREGNPPKLLRSRFFFSFDVTGSSQPEITKNIDKIKLEWDEFAKQELYPKLQSERDQGFILWHGDTVTSHELVLTLQKDLLMAIGSISVVLLCLWFQMQAFVISMACLIVIMLSVPLAYVMTPAEKLTVTSFLAVFLIVGIGSDTVFVYADFWEQDSKNPSIASRVANTIRVAGTNCSATCLTTAASFLANLASVLQPLREFGLLIGLCVIWSFVLITLYLPPMLVIQEKARRRALKSSNAEMMNDAQQAVSPASLAAIVPTSVTENGEVAVWKSQSSREKRGSRIIRWWLSALMNRVKFCPSVIVIISSLLVVLFVVGIAADFRISSGVPQMFPDGHNQVEFPKQQQKFASVPRTDVSASEPEKSARVCSIPLQQRQNSPESCRLFWCDEAEEPIPTDTCWGAGPWYDNGGSANISTCASLTVSLDVAAALQPSGASWKPAAEDMARAMASMDFGIFRSQTSVVERNSLVTESWSTGKAATSRFFRVAEVEMRMLAQSVSSAQAPCFASTVCFSGVPQCLANRSWKPLGNRSRRLLADVSEEQNWHSNSDARLLSTQLIRVPTVPNNKQIDVTIVWGIRAPKSTPLIGPNAQQWSYDPTYEQRNPWAQRAVLDVCKDVPGRLKIITYRCWIVDFRNDLLNIGQRFPSRDFDAQMVAWAPTSVSGTEQLWVVDGTVAASMLTFRVDVSSGAGSSTILDYKALWDQYLGDLNSRASITANAAWNTAAAWVSAEAEKAIIDSTMVTILVAASSGWVCMLIFTGDPSLAGLVLILVLGVIIGLCFFMVVLMGWAVGPIEVISLVVFVGYAVTYALHVAHIFGADAADRSSAEVENGSELAEVTQEGADLETQGVLTGDREEVVIDTQPVDREVIDREANDPTASKASEDHKTFSQQKKARVAKALQRVGVATVSSAASTVGASVWLLGATMQVFTKLGAVVIAVSVLSCIASLIVLPAALIMFGPGGDPWHVRMSRWISSWLPTRRPTETTEADEVTPEAG